MDQFPQVLGAFCPPAVTGVFMKRWMAKFSPCAGSTDATKKWCPCRTLGVPRKVIGPNDKHTYNLIIDKKVREVGEDSAEDGVFVDLGSGRQLGLDGCSTGTHEATPAAAQG